MVVALGNMQPCQGMPSGIRQARGCTWLCCGYCRLQMSRQTCMSKSNGQQLLCKPPHAAWISACMALQWLLAWLVSRRLPAGIFQQLHQLCPVLLFGWRARGRRLCNLVGRCSNSERRGSTVCRRIGGRIIGCPGGDPRHCWGYVRRCGRPQGLLIERTHIHRLCLESALGGL